MIGRLELPFNRVIPALLLRQGRLVKGCSFTGHRDAGAPGTTARAYDAQGADELILIDIDATREGRGPDLRSVAEVARNCRTPLTVGGGVASVEIAAACFRAGADKLCLNSTALARPSLIAELAQVYGRQAIVLGVDVIKEGADWRLFDHRNAKSSALDWRGWIDRAVGLGAGEVRLVSVDREGSRQGLDLELWAAARSVASVPMILEGGAGTLDHLAQAMLRGVDSVALGTMLVFSDNNIVQLKRRLKNAGLAMRL